MIAGIIWLIITLFSIITTGINNIIWAILLGLVYIGYYFLSVKGYNPIIIGLKSLWRGGIEGNGQGDYGIKDEEVSGHFKNEGEKK